MRFAANSIDAAVRSAALGHLHQPVIYPDLFEIDHFRFALILSHLYPLRNTIDRDHPFSAQHPRALHREQPNRTAAPDSDCVTGLDVAVLSRHITSRED